MTCCGVILEENVKRHNMAKIYSQKKQVNTNMKPKKEVIAFLLNYSKALHVVKVEDKCFEMIVN